MVINSCPCTTPAVHALAGALSRGTPGDRDAAPAAYGELVEAGRRGADVAEASQMIHAARVLREYGDFWAELDERLWEFTKREQGHDPIPDVLRLHCPHLALFGGSWRAGHPDRRSAPGAGHRIQLDGGTRLAPGYLETLTSWVRDGRRRC
ncbi:hypothetical protein L3Q67_19240 [Saccharothrix sp. AJ9571]|nr:hypothetical protein L3Q67_19240 [Saccharothrix sp. AJ9571]